jgi:hypothetical protein
VEERGGNNGGEGEQVEGGERIRGEGIRRGDVT